MLALRLKTSVVPERVVNAITKVFWPLFLPPVVVAVLGALVVLDVWLFAFHGIAPSFRQTLYNPAFILLLLGLVVVSAAFHECGHATACRYGGARPGVMGVGIYIVWPAFYTDVTDAYRLGKGGRLRTDLGGVYFNVIFTLGTAAAYFITGFEPLLLVIPLQHIEILHQFLPFVRLDGYYIISDLTGVPDMLSRVRQAGYESSLTLYHGLSWGFSKQSTRGCQSATSARTLNGTATLSGISLMPSAVRRGPPPVRGRAVIVVSAAEQTLAHETVSFSRGRPPVRPHRPDGSSLVGLLVAERADRSRSSIPLPSGVK